uniref:Putative ovule protein n=1 Tax=Solanum chacoense TaxID=4108 RepID=A0A0V0H741_SOLCH
MSSRFPVISIRIVGGIYSSYTRDTVDSIYFKPKGSPTVFLFCSSGYVQHKSIETRHGYLFTFCLFL